MDKNKNNFTNLHSADENDDALDLNLINHTSLLRKSVKKAKAAALVQETRKQNELEGLEKIQSNVIRILLLEDSETDADLLIRHLRKEKIDFEYIRVWDKDAFLEQLTVFA